MERREVVKYISILLGGAVVGGSSFLTGCKSETGKPQNWDANEIAYLDEIAETILPQTSTPGAKAAKVGDFMKVMINDCYEESDQKAFREGMTKLNEESRKKFDKEFMEISPEQRKELLIAIDLEAKAYQKERVNKFNDAENEKYKQDPKYVKQHMSPHYFTMMKQLTLMGYFTSEIGAKQALRYLPVPGRFEGCIPYKKGDKAFA
jgi:hypothetical protein